MDTLMFSDKILNKQICTLCYEYLSVGPVWVSCYEQIVCGRCTKDMVNAHKDLYYSMYNVVAEKLIFKCINHYNGCKELLFFNEPLVHEQECDYGEGDGFVCPFDVNDEDEEEHGNGCQMIQHFRLDHSDELIVEGATFKLVVADKFSKKLVLVENGRILCMSMFVQGKSIEVFNLLLTPGQSEEEYFTLRFFKSGSNEQYVTPPIQFNRDRGHFLTSIPAVGHKKNCFSLNYADILTIFLSGWCLCKVELGDKVYTDLHGVDLSCFGRILEKMAIKLSPSSESGSTVLKEAYELAREGDFCLMEYVLKLPTTELRQFINTELYKWQICGNCKTRMYGTAFYFCPKFHMACKKCTRFKCPGCGTFCEWSDKSQLHTFTLSCEWANCNTNVNIFDYMTHKRNCQFRQYRCPGAECKFVGNLEILKSHWHLTPLELTPMYLTLPFSNHHTYWLLNDELFHIVTDFVEVSKKFSVTINAADVVMLGAYDFYLNVLSKTKSKPKFVKTVLPTSINFLKFLDEEELTQRFIMRWAYMCSEMSS